MRKMFTKTLIYTFLVDLNRPYLARFSSCNQMDLCPIIWRIYPECVNYLSYPINPGTSECARLENKVDTLL